jgi:hypothetical protein
MIRFSLTLLLAVSALAAEHPLLLQKLTVNKTHIVFSPRQITDRVSKRVNVLNRAVLLGACNGTSALN